MLIFLIWPALIGSAVAGIGSWLGGKGKDKRAAQEAVKDRSFQERMRNTSWQAGVLDMEKAGLNPALAYSQGGAAQPGGAIAQTSDVISPAVSSAQQARRLEKELKEMDQRIDTGYNKARLDSAAAGREAANTQLIYRQQKQQEIQNEIAGLSLFSARNVAGMQNTKFGKVLPYMQSIMGLSPKLNLGAALVGGRGTSTTRTTGGRWGPTESITTRRR